MTLGALELFHLPEGEAVKVMRVRIVGPPVGCDLQGDDRAGVITRLIKTDALAPGVDDLFRRRRFDL
jgi:hypothetical protein